MKEYRKDLVNRQLVSFESSSQCQMVHSNLHVGFGSRLSMRRILSDPTLSKVTL